MKGKFRIAITIALMLSLIAATIVLADDLLSDGDGLAPVVDTPTLALGNVCTGTTITKPIAHAIVRGGGGGITFSNGASVVVSIDSVSGPGLSASGGGTIKLPSNWVSQADGTKSADVTSSITFVAGPTPRSFSGTVNYSASGNRSTNGTLTRTDSLTVAATVVNCDTTPPALNLPTNMTVEATGASGAAVSFTATADDANPAHPVVTCTPASGSTFGLGATTVSCSATDAAGNTGTGSFTVTVQDITPPTVTPPDSITMEAAGPDGVEVTYSGESAYDIVDGARPVSCVPASGSIFALGETTVTCTASDTRGNIGAASFTVKVQDTTAPILALPADITEEAASASGAVVTFSASASDTVDGALTPSCNANSGDTFPLGVTTVSCSATDSNGNTASNSFKVTVVDTTSPALTLPASFSVEATGPNGAVATYSASASDLVDGSVAVSCTPSSDSVFPLGATSVSCSATDAAGNTGTGAFSVTVVDTTPPTLTIPADQEIEASGPSGAVATFTASAIDLVDGALAVSCVPASGATFPLGTTTVNCSVSDAAGNPASGSFVIIVKDTTPPVITFVNRTPANGKGWNNGDVTVNWGCSDIVGVVSDTVSETVSTEGADQSATGTCTDTSGNPSSDTQNGINIDKTKPSASASRAPDANSFGWNNVDVTVSFSGTDGLSGIDTCSADQVFSGGAGQSASGTCTDKAGNISETATVSNINVDKTAPTITGMPDRAPNRNDWYDADVTVTFTCGDTLSGVDSCSAPVTLDEGSSQSVPGSVTDKAGNSASTTANGINIDKTKPIISAALDKFPAENGWFNIATGKPTVSFNCSDPLSGLAGVCPDSHQFDDGAGQSYSQSVSDLAGNTASAGVSSVNVDMTAPSISASISPARPASGWWNIASGAPTVTYTCSDGTSGMASCTAPYTFPEDVDQAHTGTATDNAGNNASTGVTGIDVDLTSPALTWDPAMIANGASFHFGFVPAYPPNPCVASDLLSGPNGCNVTGYAATVGAHTLTATAHDTAGNYYSESRSYTVLAWRLSGFYQPVDMNGIYNVVKNGSTVPLKFEVFAGPVELTDVAYIKSLTYAQTTCSTTAITDEIETLATGNTVLRYDSTSGQFIFNWKTPSTAGKCYRVTMVTQDGSSLVAFFKLK